MARLVILGAAGSLGRHVLRQALAAGHDVTVVVRDASQLENQVKEHVPVHVADLLAEVPVTALAGPDALINCAGHVAGGEAFVRLVDRVVRGVESLPGAERPACWFLAGAALLDLDPSGRRGVDLPRVGSTYWPHARNLERLGRSSLDWRLLSPGPMVEGAPFGIERLRLALDSLPVALPAFARLLPGPLLLPLFAAAIPRMIVPYADAAAVMLANLDRGNRMYRHRVGIALPAGVRGRKPRWTAAPRAAARGGE